MSFKDEIAKLSNQVALRKEYVENEETTKHSLIVPFFQVLGYDVFNPLEVKPEFIADFGLKRGEKVDYAIFKNGAPIIFIEAKSISEKLINHNAQLSRYFNSTPEVKVGLLTNGIEYKFFTDLIQHNVMDDSPFFEFNILSPSDSDIETIAQFRKEVFDAENIVKYAEELVYMANLNKNLRELFKNPSDEFIRLLIKNFSDSRITAAVIDRFKPIVKNAISRTLVEMVSQGLYKQASAEPESDPIEEDKSTDPATEIQAGIVTTDEELESFEIVKSVLEKNGRDVSQLKYKDTTNYFGIMNRSGLNWFVRINLNTVNKHIITRLPVEELIEHAAGRPVEVAPKGIGESRVIINSHKDLIDLESLILKCFDTVIGDVR